MYGRASLRKLLGLAKGRWGRGGGGGVVRDTDSDCRQVIKAVALYQQFRSRIALCSDLSRITTEMWEIPAFSLADGALILHMITQHYFLA